MVGKRGSGIGALPVALSTLILEDHGDAISSPSSSSVASNPPMPPARSSFLGKRKMPNNGSSSLSLPTDINNSTHNPSRRGSATSGSVTLEAQEEEES